jgi:hypothetical protein
MPRASSRGDFPIDERRFRRMRAGLALGILAVGAMASLRGSWGQSAIDLTGAGYIIVQRTTVEGFFQGCERKLELHLTNGTVFDCGERNHHMAYRPKAVILRNMRVRTYALMIDGRAYTGSLTALLGQPLQIPLPVTPPQAVEAGPQAGLIPGVQFPKYAKAPERAKGETLIPVYPAGQAIPIQGQ